MQVVKELHIEKTVLGTIGKLYSIYKLKLVIDTSHVAITFHINTYGY